MYASGSICFGTKWLPSEGLELLVRRVAQIITFDPSILNVDSPANVDAKTWYLGARQRYPGNFPTDTFSFERAEQKKTMSWTNLSQPSADERVTVFCANCKAKLRVPRGRTGMIKCPECQTRFEVST